MALNRPRKGHLLLVWELKQEGRVSPHLTSAGNSKVFTTLHASANERAMRTDLGVTDQVHGVGKFAETESTDNGDRLQLKEEKCLAPKQRGSHKGLAALAGPAVIFPTPLCSRQQRWTLASSLLIRRLGGGLPVPRDRRWGFFFFHWFLCSHSRRGFTHCSGFFLYFTSKTSSEEEGPSARFHVAQMQEVVWDLISNDEKIICDHKEPGRITWRCLTELAVFAHDGL